MADIMEAREKVEARIECALNGRTAEEALKIVGEVCALAEEAGEEWEGAIKGYYATVTGADPYERPGIGRRRQKGRTILMMRDALNGAGIKRRYDFGDKGKKSEVYADELEAFEGQLVGLGMSEATVYTKVWRANVLFEYLEDAGVGSLPEFGPEALIEFMAWLSARYTPAGAKNILASLRGLFECPEVARLLTFDPSGLLCNIRTPKHNKIPSVYTAEEISLALSTIDRDTDPGRALYLVLALATVYGLRSRDIKELRIDDVDFRHDAIHIVQHKTGAPLDLPLVEAVKLPLLDYLANTRRDCPYHEAMIKHRGAAEPYEHLGNFSTALHRAFESSGVELRGRKAGLHSLRHSLASGMHASGVPANEITGVLGHRALRSVQDYIWSDVERLRTAALEV